MLRNRLIKLLAVASFAAVATPAFALTDVGDGGADGIWPCTGISFSIGYVAPCYGSVKPPPNDSLADVNLVFSTGFDTALKDENIGVGSDVLAFDARQTGLATGTITFGAGFTDPFVLVLKLGQGWSAYYFTADFSSGDVLSFAPNGTFNFAGTQGGFGLSHATIYSSCNGRDCQEIPPPLPEPGTLALLGAGLAGLAMIRRRRRN